MEEPQSADWLRITVQVTPAAAEAAGELLRRAGCTGWESPQADTVVGYLAADEQAGARAAAVWDQVRILQRFGLDPGPALVRVESVPGQPWEEVWKDYFRPMRVGRVLVCPTWETAEPGPDEVVVRLDPGMAFGSGAHATTRLCLHALQEELPARGSVADIGAGSGILAIAAARLGAARVLAVDNDPDVLPIAAENAERNGVAQAVEIREGDVLLVCGAAWDVIVANIAPDPVIQAAPVAQAHLSPAGAFIAGGIPAVRVEDVQAGLAAAGLRVDRILHEEEWVAIIARPVAAAHVPPSIQDR